MCNSASVNGQSLTETVWFISFYNSCSVMASSQYYALQPQQDEVLEFTTAGSKDDHGSNGDSELHSRSELLFHRKLHMSFDLNRTMITPTSFGFEEMILFPIINQRDALNMVI